MIHVLPDDKLKILRTFLVSVAELRFRPGGVEQAVIINTFRTSQRHTPIYKALLSLVQEIQAGDFASFAKYLYLDDLVYSRSVGDSSDIVGLKKPKLVLQAAKILEENKLDPRFSAQLEKFNREIKDAERIAQERVLERRRLESQARDNELARKQKENAKRKEEIQKLAQLRERYLEAARKALIEQQEASIAAYQEAQQKVREDKERRLVILQAEKERALQKDHRIRNLISSFPALWDSGIDEMRINLDPAITLEDIKEAKQKCVVNWFKEKGLPVPSEEQTLVISDLSKDLRVVARAGSGKTRTIASKILFLVHFIGVTPSSILALAFNKKAAIELRERIERYQQSAQLPDLGHYHILTFDSLAVNLVKPKENILEDHSQFKLINGLVKDALFNEESLRSRVEKLLLAHFRADWEETLRQLSLTSAEELTKLRGSFSYTSLDQRHLLKSKGEKRIADFLFEHDIPYLYEHPFTTDDGDMLRPDFYIPSPGVIIEYYGLLGDPTYEEKINFKRKFWQSKPGLILVEIIPDAICSRQSAFSETREQDYQYLSSLLSLCTQGLETPLSPQLLKDDEIINRLREQINLAFSKLVSSALTRIALNYGSDVELISALYRYEPASSVESSFLEILPYFNSMYKDRMRNNGLTDFASVKRQAIELIASGVTSINYANNKAFLNLKKLKHIFIDEYQDFSELLRGLLMAIKCASQSALINVVGDDWQMINRFAGSKPDLFNNFERDHPGAATLYLTTNYRSSPKIVDFCNSLMKGRGTPSRPANHSLGLSSFIGLLYMDRLVQSPAENYFFDGDMIMSSIFRVIKSAYDTFGTTDRGPEEKLFYVLSRKRFLPIKKTLSRYYSGDGLLKGLDLASLVVNKLSPPSSRPFCDLLTAHQSKGLEADCVLVLLPRQYPLFHPNSVFLRFFGDSPEQILQDELNLFYVACTRAKSWLFFLAENETALGYFLEARPGFAKKYTLDWSRFPPDPSLMVEAYTITVVSGTTSSSDLYDAKVFLKARGFRFHRPNQVDTWSILLQDSLEHCEGFLNALMRDCSAYGLKYTVLNSLNEVIRTYPS